MILSPWLGMTLLLVARVPAAPAPSLPVSHAGPGAAPASPRPASPVQITARTLEVLPKSRQALWEHDVVAERDDFRLACDRLTADYDGTKRLRRLSCSGNVHLLQKSDPPREGWGEHAVFEEETGELTLTGTQPEAPGAGASRAGFPRASEGGRSLTGSQVVFRLRENLLKVERPELHAVEEGRPLTVSARSLEIPRDASQAVWKGEVVAARDDFRMTCDRMAVDYEDQALRRLTCGGNVHLVQLSPGHKPGTRPAREGWGEKAVFEPRKSTAVLTGAPRARDGESTMDGSRVTWFVDSRKLRVENPTMVLETGRGRGAPK